jgi:hypothetical protein
MNCPYCNVIARIDHRADVIKKNEDGLKIYTRIFYKCRTSSCPNYNKVFTSEDIPSESQLLIEEPEVQDE